MQKNNTLYLQYIITIIIMYYNGYAQNIVPLGRNLLYNPSFENGIIGGGPNLPYLATSWNDIEGAGGSYNGIFDDRDQPPILFNCPASGYWIPRNEYGCENLNTTGHRYAGIYLTDWASKRGGICGTLDEPLMPGFEYKFFAYAAAGEAGVGSPKLALRLGNNNHWTQYSPTIKQWDVSLNNWQQISTYFDVSSPFSKVLLRIKCGGFCTFPFGTPKQYLFIDNIDIHITSLKPCFLYDLASELTNRSLSGTWNFSVIHNITAQNTLITSNGNVVFQAGNMVILKSGFHAKKGSKFHAFNSPCNGNRLFPPGSDTEAEPISLPVFTEAEKSRYEGVNEGASTLTLHPNPTSGRFTVEWRGSGIGELSIRNLFGQEVYRDRIPAGSTAIDLSGQAAGMYFVRLRAQEGSLIKKLLVR